MDRPDREKIADIMFRRPYLELIVTEQLKVDQILALIEPLIKEAKQEVWTRYRSGHFTALSIAVEEAKKQERERIILELEDDGLLAHEIKSYGASGRECNETCGSCKLLQALKEGQ